MIHILLQKSNRHYLFKYSFHESIEILAVAKLPNKNSQADIRPLAFSIWLKNTINTIKVVLLDAEKGQRQDHAVNLWLKRLKVPVYNADDLCV